MQTETGARARPDTAESSGLMRSLHGGLRWGVDRMLSVGYGLVYDYIYEQFRPYQQLQSEVLELVAAGVPAGTLKRDVHVLEIGCGPGNFTFVLAEAGFNAIGLESYAALVELAREKRRAKRLANLAFRHGDLADGAGIREASFDEVVNIHSLYVHPEPETLLKEAYRILKPGGHAIFVNHTRQVAQWSTFREIKCRDGLKPALSSLLWLVPNSIFEAARRRIGPHYWNETQFATKLRAAGFTVLQARRTFVNGASLLMWARKDD
ncbi:MAG TPA: class I SAM-dependent methyltransferase [Methylomirabilota bacterium]|jgi:SAM-dependent methyltransferase